MDVIGHAYDVLLTAAVIILAVLVIFSIIRSVLGPRIADRIIAINMTGTMIIMMIAILSVFLDENYLVDICLIYAMISFLGVVVLCKVYTGVYLQKRNRKATMEAVEKNLEEQNRKEKNLEEQKRKERNLAGHCRQGGENTGPAEASGLGKGEAL